MIGYRRIGRDGRRMLLEFRAHERHDGRPRAVGPNSGIGLRDLLGRPAGSRVVVDPPEKVGGGARVLEFYELTTRGRNVARQLEDDARRRREGLPSRSAAKNGRDRRGRTVLGEVARHPLEVDSSAAYQLETILLGMAPPPVYGRDVYDMIRHRERGRLLAVPLVGSVPTEFSWSEPIVDRDPGDEDDGGRLRVTSATYGATVRLSPAELAELRARPPLASDYDHLAAAALYGATRKEQT